MATIQRYISDELTHFVGRNLKIREMSKDKLMEKQYERLIKIIKEGRIGSDSHTIEQLPDGLKYYPNVSIEMYHMIDVSSNDMMNPQMTCFCDIPIGDLGIHIKKYSHFGLSFSKSFLIERGANPVFYIVRDSAIHYTTRNKHFNDKIKYFQEKCCENPDNEGCRVIEDFMIELLSYLKFFDSNQLDDAEDNFYMEREWRSLYTILFCVDDICRIILPKSFSERLREDIPTYCGQITFSDAY